MFILWKKAEILRLMDMPRKEEKGLCKAKGRLMKGMSPLHSRVPKGKLAFSNRRAMCCHDNFPQSDACENSKAETGGSSRFSLLELFSNSRTIFIKTS